MIVPVELLVGTDQQAVLAERLGFVGTDEIQVQGGKLVLLCNLYCCHQ